MLKKLFLPKYWIIIGIPILFLIGTLFHFLYEWTGKNSFIGAFVPINESVWEHTKMVVLPIILWWGIYYFIKKDKFNLSANQWFTAALISLLTAILTIPLLFYFYTGAFGVESVIIDILILLIALGIGQMIGYHVYKYSKGISYIIPVVLFTAILVIYIIFTFYPPHLPIFIDSTDGTYGILNFM